jgi:hypothetical protein
VQTWTGLIPGAYAITEAGLSAAWTQSGDTSATVPSDGGQATAGVTNTRKLGSLDVQKIVNWNGATPNQNRVFEICIAGPSYPEPTAANGGCRNVGFNGGTLTWTDLIPGEYAAVETNPGPAWTLDGASSTIAVPTNGSKSDDVAVITNTRKLGSIEVTKVVDWNGVTPVEAQSFSICVTGPSYPAPTADNGGCKTIGFQGGVLAWTNLVAGVYVVSEVDPGVDWRVDITGSPVTVSADGGEGLATVTNTHRLVEVLGEELARTGGSADVALGLAALAVLLVAGRRVARRFDVV